MSEDHAGLLDHLATGFTDLGFLDFQPQVSAFTGSFTDTGEHGIATVAASDPSDQLGQNHGFPQTSTTEQTGFWPGLIDHLRSAVRSGAGVSDAVVYLVDRVPEEMRPAFQHFHEALDHGSSVDQALRGVKTELADPVGDRVIEALRLAHDVGGSDLPVVLDSLQHSVRADIAVREDARAKQAWIRAASRLGVAAPWLVLIVLSGRDETVEAYSSATGVGLVLAGALVSTLAFRAMATLGSLPSQRRWFAAEPARVGA